MSNYNRAAQFSPFAALTGYEDIILETSRTTNEKIEIDEYKIAEINSVLNYLKDNLNTKVNIVYFVKDEYKDGGSYINQETYIKKIIEDEHLLLTNDGNTINIDDIYSIDIC